MGNDQKQDKFCYKEASVTLPFTTKVVFCLTLLFSLACRGGVTRLGVVLVFVSRLGVVLVFASRLGVVLVFVSWLGVVLVFVSSSSWRRRIDLLGVPTVAVDLLGVAAAVDLLGVVLCLLLLPGESVGVPSISFLSAFFVGDSTIRVSLNGLLVLLLLASGVLRFFGVRERGLLVWVDAAQRQYHKI